MTLSSSLIRREKRLISSRYSKGGVCKMSENRAHVGSGVEPREVNTEGTVQRLYLRAHGTAVSQEISLRQEEIRGWGNRSGRRSEWCSQGRGQEGSKQQPQLSLRCKRGTWLVHRRRLWVRAERKPLS